MGVLNFVFRRGRSEGVGSPFRPTDSASGNRPWPKRTPDPLGSVQSGKSAAPPLQESPLSSFPAFPLFPLASGQFRRGGTVIHLPGRPRPSPAT